MTFSAHKNHPLFSYCAVCAKRTDEARLVFLGEGKGFHVLHLTCEVCKAFTLVLARLQDASESMIGVVTDLGAEEVLSLLSERSVSINDVIFLHESLQEPTLWKSRGNLVEKQVQKLPKKSKT